MDEQASISPERLDEPDYEPASPDRGLVAEGQHRVATELARVPWWTVVAAGAAPVLLAGGFVVAAALQPANYSSIRDTISALAAQGANDRWVMEVAIAAAGLCYLLTALGLQPARRAGRALLASGGVATVLIAAFPLPRHGYSTSHVLAVVAATATMCAWPIFAAHRRHQAPLLTLRASVTAALLVFGLAMWFVYEQHHDAVGLAERCAAVAAALWLFPVVATTRRALSPVSSREKLADTIATESSASIETSMAEMSRFAPATTPNELAESSAMTSAPAMDPSVTDTSRRAS